MGGASSNLGDVRPALVGVVWGGLVPFGCNGKFIAVHMCTYVYLHTYVHTYVGGWTRTT